MSARRGRAAASTFRNAAETELPDLPPLVRSAVGPRTLVPVPLGCSSADVFLLTARRRAGLYLKRQPLGAGPPLAEERDRIAWIGGRLPVPEVVAWIEEDGCEFLVTTAIGGRPASEAEDGAATARLLGEALRRVHELPVDACPFDVRVDAALAASRRNAERGWVDESDFDPERVGRTAADILAEAERSRPAEGRVVFTHGDASAANFLVRGGRLTGIVDWGGAGASDPWRDLALATGSVTWNHGPGHEEELLAAYGVNELDRERVAWWRLVDELW